MPKPKQEQVEKKFTQRFEFENAFDYSTNNMVKKMVQMTCPYAACNAVEHQVLK